ncbi:coil containing protein [Vibrio phage 2.275.O._10N.286.54.E11]|nr:coil containing protein [Vibrio phage 2.275.O._10N.286.54.E11]
MTTVFDAMMTESALDLNSDNNELCETCIDHGHDECLCGAKEEENKGETKMFTSISGSIDEQIAKLEALKAEKEEEEELDRIQAEAEEDSEEAKAQKLAEKKKKRLEAARARFMKKVESTYNIDIAEHTRTYRTESKNAVGGELVEMIVHSGSATVYVGYPQPNAPQVQANASNDRGGRKLSIDEDDLHGTVGSNGVDRRSKMTAAQKEKVCASIKAETAAITLWD